MLNSSKSQLLFVLFTLFQILLFVFLPYTYDGVAQGFEGPPLRSSIRLIGVKDLGVCLLYTSGIVNGEDSFVAWMTVVGRWSVLAFTPFVIYWYGAPNSTWAGVVQDVAGAAVTLHFLMQERNLKKLKRMDKWIKFELTTLGVVVMGVIGVVAGGVELYRGAKTFLDPESQGVAPKPLFGEPVFLGMRSFGYMSCLVGLYQITLSLRALVTQSHDVVVFIAMALHHLIFYTMCKVTLTHITGEEFTPYVEHFILGLTLAMGCLIFQKGKRNVE